MILVLEVFTLFVMAAVIGAPKNSVYEAMKQKCKSMDNSTEISNIIKNCGLWTDIHNVNTEAGLHLDDSKKVLCLLLTESLQEYCLHNFTINKEDLSKMNKPINKICDDLPKALEKIYPEAPENPDKSRSPDILKILKANKTCETLCINLDGESNKICSVSYYFINYIIENSPKVETPIKSEDVISQNLNASTNALTEQSGAENVTNKIIKSNQEKTAKIQTEEILEATINDANKPIDKISANSDLDDNKNRANPGDKSPDNKEDKPNNEHAVMPVNDPDQTPVGKENTNGNDETNARNAIDTGQRTEINIDPKKELNTKQEESPIVDTENKIDIDDENKTDDENQEDKPDEYVEDKKINEVDFPPKLENDKVAEENTALKTDIDNEHLVDDVSSYPMELDGDSYFFSYFMVICIIFVLGYVVYHNKQKLLALIVEGRQGKRQYRGRRPNSASYHKLDSNLEEAISSTCNKNTTNVIY